MFWRHQATLQEESLSSFLRITWFYPVMPFFAKPLDGPIFRQGTRHSCLAVSEKNSLPFHLPTLSIPVMALKLLLVTRRCSIPFLVNPKEACILLPVLIKVNKKASANLLFYYILRKRLIEIEEPIAPIKIPNPKRPPTMIGTKTCGL